MRYFFFFFAWLAASPLLLFKYDRINQPRGQAGDTDADRPIETRIPA